MNKLAALYPALGGYVLATIVSACSPTAKQVEAKILRALVLDTGVVCVIEARNSEEARAICAEAARANLNLVDALTDGGAKAPAAKTDAQ